MTPGEEGFLLLTSHLGVPDRKVLTTPQLRELALRVRAREPEQPDRELLPEDLMQLGFRREMAERIAALLNQREVLEYYRKKGEQAGCTPITRLSSWYPAQLRRRLGLDCPGVLWGKGDLSLLDRPAVSLAGSRALRAKNRDFAEQAGVQAARQGYALVSGNARGTDRQGQEACLAAGGWVISVVADRLDQQPLRERVLYLSEDGYDEDFTNQRALSRNRIIHALGQMTLVAQCGLRKGGTWNGTMQNLRFGWSPVFALEDGSEAMGLLAAAGATLITQEALENLSELHKSNPGLFDQ